MKVVLGRIFSKVELRLAPGYAPRIVRRGITLIPADGVPVVLDSSRARA